MTTTRAIATLLFLAAALATTAQKPSVVVIDKVNIVDGRGGPPIRNGRIVIDQGIIREIETASAKAPIPSGALLIDAGGKWAIPGMVDAHVHFDQSASIYTRPDIIDLRLRRPYPAEIAWIQERMPATLPRYLASGVTSVVDMGGPFWTFDLRARAATISDAPRIAAAGPLLGTYPSPELESADSPVLVLTTAARARELVRRIAERKPDIIKILWDVKTGDDLTSQSAIVRAAIDESHRAQIRVAVHALELETAKAALRAGADILAHSVEEGAVDQEFIDLATAQNILYIPTLAVVPNYYKVLGHPGKAVELTDIERRLGDPLVIESWAELARIPFDQAGNLPFIPPPERRPPMFNNLRKVAAAGIRIAVGTDAGNIGTLHGPAIHHEMELMADAGMKPADILVAATRNGAAVMGRQKDLGTIEPGKAADLVLLDADPTANVKNMRRIFRVMKGGAFIDSQR